MTNYREKMREYVKELNEYSGQCDVWEILYVGQRKLIERLLDEMDSADIVIKRQDEEKQQLISFLEDRIEESKNKIYEKMKETTNDCWKIEILKRKIVDFQEILDYVKGSKDE